MTKTMISAVIGASIAFPLSAAALAAQLAGQQGDTVASRTLAPGVEYRHVVEPSKGFDMQVVRVDLRHAGIEIRAARARDSLRGREKVSDMARRAARDGARVVAAVNADFFELGTGENENNQVIDGEWWKGLKVTDSPYDTWDATHSQLAIDATGRPSLDYYRLDGIAIAHGVATPIITLNFNPTGRYEGTALYTARYGRVTPRDTSRRTVEAPLAFVARRGDTSVYVRRGATRDVSGGAIPANGAVLAAYGAGLRANEVRAMQDGDTVMTILETQPRLAAAPRVVIGGWPRILQGAVDVSARAASLEGTISRNAEMKHPRTAVGYSRDGGTLFVVTVDGRGESVGGMTLSELADHLRRLGAWDALNFDGGGSTTMVIDGAVANKPSDATGERTVGNALLVLTKAAGPP